MTTGAHRRAGGRPAVRWLLGIGAAALVVAVLVLAVVLGSPGRGSSGVGDASPTAAPAPTVGPAPAAGPAAPSASPAATTDAAAATSLAARLGALQNGAPVLFEPSGSTLTPAGRTALGQVAAALRDAPSVPVTVTGYAAPALPRDPALGERVSRERADAAVAVLTRTGVEPGRLRAVAGGADPRPTPAESRRVVVAVA